MAVAVACRSVAPGSGGSPIPAALAAVLDGRSTRVYWLQTALIAAYLVWLLALYATNGRRESAGCLNAGNAE